RPIPGPGCSSGWSAAHEPERAASAPASRAWPAARSPEPRRSRPRHHHTIAYICQGMTTSPSRRTPDRPPANPEIRPTGRISLLGLEGYGHHGDLPAERELGAQFTLDLELSTDTR